MVISDFLHSDTAPNKYLDSPCADVFVHQNLQNIMRLMKYSLEATNPWISKYFDEFDKKSPSSFRNIQDFFKFWISSYDDELKSLIGEKESSLEQLNFATGWR